MIAFNPQTQGVAFDDPPVIKVDVVENGNITANQTVTLFSNAVMKWRGECFITTGLNLWVKTRMVIMNSRL